jgi:hypothetical protein
MTRYHFENGSQEPDNPGTALPAARSTFLTLFHRFLWLSLEFHSLGY